jgi:acetyl-CoA C-acetyltransferase
VPLDAIEQVTMGCVLQAGQGQAPARQAARGAGLGDATSCTTLNKMCGSGLKAVMDVHDQLLAGSVDIAIAGGMESMSNAPYLLAKARTGLRMGHGEIKDHMFLDGLEDAYDKGRLMGSFAEETAKHYQFTRAEQDAFAIESLTRAKNAIAQGAFAHEIAPLTQGDVVLNVDEQPGKAKLDKIPALKPAFAKDGTVTAANSSSISDGAAALVMMRASHAQAHGLKPLAKITGHASFAQAPAWFTTAPVFAIQKLLAKLGRKAQDIDLYEINEAFAVVTMAAQRDLRLDPAQVNVHGGACALGHPIGASGARVLVTLLHALERHNKQSGIASLCIGGGEAVALSVERV